MHVRAYRVVYVFCLVYFYGAIEGENCLQQELYLYTQNIMSDEVFFFFFNLLKHDLTPEVNRNFLHRHIVAFHRFVKIIIK